MKNPETIAIFYIAKYNYISIRQHFPNRKFQFNHISGNHRIGIKLIRFATKDLIEWNLIRYLGWNWWFWNVWLGIKWVHFELIKYEDKNAKCLAADLKKVWKYYIVPFTLQFYMIVFAQNVNVYFILCVCVGVHHIVLKNVIARSVCVCVCFVDGGVCCHVEGIFMKN